MVYADTEGHIGYQAPGLIPIRKSGNDGRYPAEGWLPADDWTGKYVPFDALPTVLDPDDGFVATANQAVTGDDYPYYLGDSWAYGYRSQRIVDLLERRDTAQRRGHAARSSSTSATASRRRWCPTCSRSSCPRSTSAPGNGCSWAGTSTRAPTPPRRRTSTPSGSRPSS